MKYIKKSVPPPIKLNNFLLWASDNAARFSMLSGTERWKKTIEQEKS